MSSEVELIKVLGTMKNMLHLQLVLKTHMENIFFFSIWNTFLSG